MQGDRERALGQPVSALMDRSKPGIQKSQVSIALGPARVTTAAPPTVQWQQAVRCTRPSNSSADSCLLGCHALLTPADRTMLPTVWLLHRCGAPHVPVIC